MKKPQTLIWWAMLLAVFPLCGEAKSAQQRIRELFDTDWLFTLADTVGMESPAYNDKAWRRLDLPHDWAIEGDFSASAPSGASGGALPGGVGWYRKHFTLEANGKMAYLDFDGVYMNSTVWVNGHKLGTRPYGYSSFRYDITPYLNKTGDNVVAVRVDNSDQPNSRWYSGCGIYRHVWMVRTNRVHVAHWGTFVTSDDRGLNISVAVRNEQRKTVTATVENTVLDADGRKVGEASQTIDIDTLATAKTSIPIDGAHLWSVDDPYIYKVKTCVKVNSKVVDSFETATGMRTFRFDAQNGFSLNGRPMKINGVCLHHDLG